MNGLRGNGRLLLTALLLALGSFGIGCDTASSDNECSDPTAHLDASGGIEVESPEDVPA